MSNLLVTGASGFIGKSFCARMLRDGWDVRGTRLRQESKFVPGVVEVPIGPIGGGTDWSSALDGVDTVVHLAARVHVMREQSSDPLDSFREVNVAGTEQLARMAAAAGVRRLIFLSTIGVHGNSTYDRPVTENAPFFPHNAYAQSKLEAEMVLRKVTRNGSPELVIVRAPLVYGPGNPGNFLRLLSLMSSGLPLPLASVNNLRSLVYVENLADALARCVIHPAAKNEAFVISDGCDLSTPRLLSELAAALGRSPRLFPCPPGLLRWGGKMTGTSEAVKRLIDSLSVDPAAIRRKLGWVAPFSASEGLKTTAAWYLQSRMNF